jgi:predicted RNA-binding protein with EMAP domain
MVKIRGSWDIVVKANKTTIEAKTEHGMVLKYSYAEIQEIKIPENFTEINKKMETVINPYNQLRYYFYYI